MQNQTAGLGGNTRNISSICGQFVTGSVGNMPKPIYIPNENTHNFNLRI
jgi:hypothetical protein